MTLLLTDYRPVEVVRGTQGVDMQVRSAYTLDAFHGLEFGTDLQVMFDYWREKSGAGPLPQGENFNPNRDLPEHVAGRMSWIDASAADPMNFSVFNHIPSPVTQYGVALSGKRLNQIMSLGIHITACAGEYFVCQHSKLPFYHEIEQVVGGIQRHYTRLMLPVLDSDGQVTKIYYSCRPKRETRKVSIGQAGSS